MRVAAWDIETTDLKALMGRMLCCSILPITDEAHPEVPHTISIDHKDPLNDEALAVEMANTLQEFNMIVTWNGKMFDLPFLNARLLKYGHKPLQPQFHLDLMYYAGSIHVRIGSRRLINVQKYLDLSEQKTDLSWATWQEAGIGSKTALDEVMIHCEHDVAVLAEVYWRLLPYVRNIHR